MAVGVVEKLLQHEILNRPEPVRKKQYHSLQALFRFPGASSAQSSLQIMFKKLVTALSNRQLQGSLNCINHGSITAEEYLQRIHTDWMSAAISRGIRPATAKSSVLSASVGLVGE